MFPLITAADSSS